MLVECTHCTLIHTHSIVYKHFIRYLQSVRLNYLHCSGSRYRRAVGVIDNSSASIYFSLSSAGWRRRKSIALFASYTLQLGMTEIHLSDSRSYLEYTNFDYVIV